MFHGIEAKEQFISWRVEHGTNFCLKQTNKKSPGSYGCTFACLLFCHSPIEQLSVSLDVRFLWNCGHQPSSGCDGFLKNAQMLSFGMFEV